MSDSEICLLQISNQSLNTSKIKFGCVRGSGGSYRTPWDGVDGSLALGTWHLALGTSKLNNCLLKKLCNFVTENIVINMMVKIVFFTGN